MSLTSPSARRAARTFAPALTGLEDRKLMAGSLNFTGGTLSFYGDVGASHAELAPSATTPGELTATIDGTSQDFPAAAIKVAMFYSSPEGGDSFVNDTDKTSISLIRGSGNSVVGGTGADYVLDYSTDGTAVDDLGGGIVVVDGTDGKPHTVAISYTPSGSLLVRAK